MRLSIRIDCRTGEYEEWRTVPLTRAVPLLAQDCRLTRKTGFSPSETCLDSWPPLRTKQNGASRRSLSSRVHPRSAHYSPANPCNAGSFGEAGLDHCHVQVKQIGSGVPQRVSRERLPEAARRREMDAVLVWRPDRWGRSVTDLLATLQELQPLGMFHILSKRLDV